MYRSLVLVVGLGVGLWALPANAKPSTFQDTCTAPTLTTTPQAVTLNANCRKMDGKSKKSSIELKGIANMPAGLTQTGEPHSSFQNSCSGFKVVGAKITATCQDGKGGTRADKIAIDNIENIDGVLKSMP